MMRRILSLLLIPLLLVSQSVCFGHSHRGSDVTEPAGHAARPHFHVHGKHPHSHEKHHHHSHDGQRHTHHTHRHADDAREAAVLPGIQPNDDHDEDAVYVSTSEMLGAGRSLSKQLSLKKWFNAPQAWFETRAGGALNSPSVLWSQPPPIDPACPLYLRTLSLRC